MLMPQKNTPSSMPDGSLERLYREHNRRVLAAAYRVTGSRQDAEDVLQTVFLRLARRWDEVKLSDTVGSYLHRAAVNASIDLLRSRARAGAVPLNDEPGRELPDRQDVSAERRHRDREFRGRLRQALLELPDRAARIFVLRYFEELANKEIAGMLNMSQTTVAVILHRARKSLQVQLREYVRGEA